MANKVGGGDDGCKRHFHHRVGMRSIEDLEAAIAKDDNLPTATSADQRATERSCLRLFGMYESRQIKMGTSPKAAPDFTPGPLLNREKTVDMLKRGLFNLAKPLQSLDASRPWLVYWILHSLEILGERLTDDGQIRAVIDFLKRCQNPKGGFGGGPGQMSHLATTYAAVNALCILGTEEAYKTVNREALVEWLNNLRQPDGSFLVHVGGEIDIRGVYCALSVARLTNVFSPELFENTTTWLLNCQTYEGGFGGVPGMEAHGGYTFCGIAALQMLNHGHLCNVDNLLRWTASRQLGLEGGFQGRTNKLVDACYSFWQGGIFPIVNMLLKEEGQRPRGLLFDMGALQEYILICCQDPKGGLKDKPGKSVDYYHTCYALSGLSVAQYVMKEDGDVEEERIHVVGPKSNKVRPTHPLHNICFDEAISAAAFFDRLQVPRVPPSKIAA